MVSFIGEGFREIGRKVGRVNLRREARKSNRERLQALAGLGRAAWEQEVGLAAFPEIVEEIGRLEWRAGDLSAEAERLRTEKSGLDGRRRAEADRLDGERRAVTEQKSTAETKLWEAERRTRELQGALERIEARGDEIRREQTALGRQPQAEGAAAGTGRERHDRLHAEQEALAGEVPRLWADLEGLSEEILLLAEEVNRCTAEIGRVEAGRNAALSRIDAELSRVRDELQAASVESAAVGKHRADRFVRLGFGIYERGSSEPGLAESTERVRAIDQEEAGTRSGIDASLAETAAMPRLTMAKFWATGIVVPLVIVGLAYTVGAGWSNLRERKPTPAVAVTAPAAYPRADHPAYALSDRLERASSKEEVARYLLEIFRRIGLGVYTGAGKRVLGGAERSDKDFWLYDFHLRILARAFHRRNGLTLAAYGSAIGETIEGMDAPGRLTGILAGALSRRYQEAVRTPDDPGNFIVLLVDALGRRKPDPYSLAEITARPAEKITLDPVQSVLIYLEFFLRPEHGGALPSGLERWLKFLRGAATMLAPTPAYAASPCDLVKGDRGQWYWGRGVDVFVNVADTFHESEYGETTVARLFGWNAFVWGKRISSFLDKGSDVIGFLGDMLTLYGIDIHVQPQPYTIHLVHEGENRLAGIKTSVVFDAEIVSDEVLKCGWLAGKQMPANRTPIKGVELYWDFRPDISPYLEVSSLTKRSALAGGDRTKTDEFGVSYLYLQPKDCPGVAGPIRGKDFMVTVSAKVVTADPPNPSFWGPLLPLKLAPGALEYLMRGREGHARFRAEWHEGRDYTSRPRQPQKPARIQGD